MSVSQTKLSIFSDILKENILKTNKIEEEDEDGDPSKKKKSKKGKGKKKALKKQKSKSQVRKATKSSLNMLKLNQQKTTGLNTQTASPDCSSDSADDDE